MVQVHLCEADGDGRRTGSGRAKLTEEQCQAWNEGRIPEGNFCICVEGVEWILDENGEASPNYEDFFNKLYDNKYPFNPNNPVKSAPSEVKRNYDSRVKFLTRLFGYKRGDLTIEELPDFAKNPLNVTEKEKSDMNRKMQNVKGEKDDPNWNWFNEIRQRHVLTDLQKSKICKPSLQEIQKLKESKKDLELCDPNHGSKELARDCINLLKKLETEQRKSF